MNKRVVRRLLETFFRRWWLYLVPLVLLTALGVLKGTDAGSGFQSVGVVDVSKGTLLSQLTSIRGENFGYETPATATARTMNSLLRTDQFIAAVAKSAGVTSALKTGALTTIGLRQAIYVAPDGDTLLQVVATTNNPQLSAKLAKSTIDSFIQYTVNDDVSESRAAETFFQSQLTTYGAALNAAQAALADYANGHPGGPEGDRPLGEQVEIQRLKAAVDQAQAQYSTAEQKSEEARLATEQARSDATQKIRTVDEPQVPLAPVPRVKQAVMTAGIFMVVGILVTFGAVALATFMDRTLRSSDDVEQLLALPVLAVVPDVRRSRRSRRKARKQAAQHVDERPSGQPPEVPLERSTARSTVTTPSPSRRSLGRGATKPPAGGRSESPAVATDNQERDASDGASMRRSRRVERVR